MARVVDSVEDGIDRGWLRALGERAPLLHAFAQWDLEHAPDRVRFVTFRRAGAPRAYLLVWLGHPRVPVVHWPIAAEGDERLAEALPPRPLIAVVPPEAVPAVERARGPIATYSVTGLVRHPEPLPDPTARARRLRAADVDALRALAGERPPALLAPYAVLDPEREPAWGVFEGARLVGVARAQVVLPSIWVIGGVFTVPDRRNRGIAAATTAAVARAAEQAGASAGLWVREENTAAQRVYRRLAFAPVARRVWVDAGAGADGTA